MAGKEKSREKLSFSRLYCRDFEVDADAAYQDASSFVQELAQHGILLVSPDPIGESAKLPQQEPR